MAQGKRKTQATVVTHYSRPIQGDLASLIGIRTACGNWSRGDRTSRWASMITCIACVNAIERSLDSSV
jgi:hypothetical protein